MTQAQFLIYGFAIILPNSVYDLDVDSLMYHFTSTLLQIIVLYNSLMTTKRSPILFLSCTLSNLRLLHVYYYNINISVYTRSGTLSYLYQFNFFSDSFDVSVFPGT